MLRPSVGMEELCLIPDCRIDAVSRATPEKLLIVAQARCRRQHHCPACGRASGAGHSRYRRHPADLACFGQQVRITLRIRRFYCYHPAACSRRTFAERLPDLLTPHARRTHRLRQTHGRIGVALGGEAGSCVLGALGMPTSADTVLRQIRRLPLPATDTAPVVGVDDWAMRKGRT